MRAYSSNGVKMQIFQSKHYMLARGQLHVRASFTTKKESSIIVYEAFIIINFFLINFHL
jgi:hypothetical protein